MGDRASCPSNQLASDPVQLGNSPLTEERRGALRLHELLAEHITIDATTTTPAASVAPEVRSTSAQPIDARFRDVEV